MMQIARGYPMKIKIEGQAILLWELKKMWRFMLRDRPHTVTFEDDGSGFYDIKVDGAIIRQGMIVMFLGLEHRFNVDDRQCKIVLGRRYSRLSKPRCMLYVDNDLIRDIYG